ncbi:hypothetical protein IT568_09170 [bacterium]|nr:hypothetical protein [bacterium]
MNCEQCGSQMALVENSLEHKIYQCSNKSCKHEIKVKIHRHFKSKPKWYYRILGITSSRSVKPKWYKHPLVVIPTLFVLSIVGVFIVYLIGQFISTFSSSLR